VLEQRMPVGTLLHAFHAMRSGSVRLLAVWSVETMALWMHEALVLVWRWMTVCTVDWAMPKRRIASTVACIAGGLFPKHAEPESLETLDRFCTVPAR
jgi:hypothetical protein